MNDTLEFWKTYAQRKTAVFGLVVVFLFAGAIVFAHYIAPHDPDHGSGEPFEPPTWEHPSGTNDIGVDILSELLYAGRVSLFVGLVAASLIIVIGSMVGLVSGYWGGAIDEILMRCTDIVLILPRLPLMIVMATYLGSGVWVIILVYASIGWASLARQIRSQVLAIRESLFVEAAQSIGAGNTRIILYHIAPNIAGIIIANGVMEIMFAILTEAGLSFLGLGDPTQKSWGVMLYFAQIRGAFLLGAWWWVFPPGLCIALISCSFNFIGTALNDMFQLNRRYA